MNNIKAQAERKGLMVTCKPGIGVWLTFRGKTGKAMEWMSATSFTSHDQAVTNLNAENYMYGGLDFNSMMEYAANLWCERLHTIDVESQDTAKVNRFYTALYRSSFLPHELSDVGELQYGDFAITSLRMIAAAQNVVIPANIGGKIKTVTQMVSFVLVMLLCEVSSVYSLGFNMSLISNILMGITAIISVASENITCSSNLQ